jgi:hypothetical protein
MQTLEGRVIQCRLTCLDRVLPALTYLPQRYLDPSSLEAAIEDQVVGILFDFGTPVLPLRSADGNADTEKRHHEQGDYYCSSCHLPTVDLSDDSISQREREANRVHCARGRRALWIQWAEVVENW